MSHYEVHPTVELTESAIARIFDSISRGRLDPHTVHARLLSDPPKVVLSRGDALLLMPLDILWRVMACVHSRQVHPVVGVAWLLVEDEVEILELKDCDNCEDRDDCGEAQ